MQTMKPFGEVANELGPDDPIATDTFALKKGMNGNPVELEVSLLGKIFSSYLSFPFLQSNAKIISGEATLALILREISPFVSSMMRGSCRIEPAVLSFSFSPPPPS